MSAPRTIMLAFTGASGMPYGLRLLECLLASEARVWLAYSPAAQIVAKQECDLVLPTQPREATRALVARFRARDDRLTVFGCDDWNAPAASGSNPADAMAVCPCTMGTLGAIAGGLADTLIERAADVMLKERRPLVIVPRETPMSLPQLRNMVLCAEAGAMMLPAMPAFYQLPKSLDDLADFLAGKILGALGFDHDLYPPWTGKAGSPTS
jgi:flavin prenyltransferase